MPPRKRKVVAAGAEPVAKPPRTALPTKKITGGNGKADAAWLAEMIAAGEIHAPNMAEKPDNYYWDPIYQWDGLVDDVNPEFFEFFRVPSKEVRKCNGTAYIRDERGGYVIDAEWNRLTRQCIGRPARGADVCYSHGAQVPAVKAAAVRRLAEASEIVAMRLIGMTAANDEIGTPIDHKDRISASNSVLDRVGIKAGMDVQITAPGFQRVLERMFADDEDDE